MGNTFANTIGSSNQDKIAIGENINEIKSEYEDKFWSITDSEISDIKTDYKVIGVDWFNEGLIVNKVNQDEYFNANPKKKEVVNQMVKYYQNHKEKEILTQQTDFLCSRKERVCICNLNADNFRKIYLRQNYKPDDKFVSWIKKTKEPF